MKSSPNPHSGTGWVMLTGGQGTVATVPCYGELITPPTRTNRILYFRKKAQIARESYLDISPRNNGLQPKNRNPLTVVSVSN